MSESISNLDTQKIREKARKDYLSGKTSPIDYVKSLINNPPRYTRPTKSRIQVTKEKEGYLISIEENGQ